MNEKINQGTDCGDRDVEKRIQKALDEYNKEHRLDSLFFCLKVIGVGLIITFMVAVINVILTDQPLLFSLADSTVPVFSAFFLIFLTILFYSETDFWAWAMMVIFVVIMTLSVLYKKSIQVEPDDLTPYANNSCVMQKMEAAQDTRKLYKWELKEIVKGC